MMFAHDLSNAKPIQQLQQRHRTEPLPDQKLRPESIVKQTTLKPLNYSHTYEV